MTTLLEDGTAPSTSRVRCAGRFTRLLPDGSGKAPGFDFKDLVTAVKLDFRNVNQAAMQMLPILLARGLPDGKRCGSEWVARNPTRNDRKPGSFSVNLRTGRWADFATGDKGGDVISLYAYLRGIRQGEATRELAELLNMKS